MKNKNTLRGLGVSCVDDVFYLFSCTKENIRCETFTLQKSTNGITFSTLSSDAKVLSMNKRSDTFSKCSFFHLFKIKRYYYATYAIKGSKSLRIARSRNLIDWEKRHEIKNIKNGKVISDYMYRKQYVMYVVNNYSLKLYLSKNLHEWNCDGSTLIKEKDSVKILNVRTTSNGIFILYTTIATRRGIKQYDIHGALFKQDNPSQLLWKSKEPIYTTNFTKENQAKLFGANIFNNYLISYWENAEGELSLIKHSYKHASASKATSVFSSNNKKITPTKLNRVAHNPIIAPNKHNDWESSATYNPTAILHDETIHIIYRADGHNLMSVWGYAKSSDGVTIDEQLTRPIYQREMHTNTTNSLLKKIPYTSGGNSNGGCEDPRAVLIDGRIYLLFIAFDGWSSVRVALTSIDFVDFKNKKWNWKKTVLISPPNEINKNWVLFPEKINGKFAILHSFYPEILIDYFSSLDELDGNTFIKSNNTRPVDNSRDWDSWFRGVGPSPLKTKDGWLVFYHAMNHKNPDRYQLGALLLDLNDPTKIIYRTNKPILMPEKHYENEGHKWGVVYSCGAVIKNGTIFVYYGGADAFVCVATAPLKQFIDNLKKTGEVSMLIN